MVRVCGILQKPVPESAWHFYGYGRLISWCSGRGRKDLLEVCGSVACWVPTPRRISIEGRPEGGGGFQKYGGDSSICICICCASAMGLPRWRLLVELDNSSEAPEQNGMAIHGAPAGPTRTTRRRRFNEEA
jgi:hypothetical protein